MRLLFPNAQRVIVECELEKCVHCGHALAPGKTRHIRKTIQGMDGPLFVAGKTRKCINPDCGPTGQLYHAGGVLRLSLPFSTYGLDVLAYIGWQHEREQRQFIEIQRALNQRGLRVNARTVGKLYRQFLALLGGATEKTLRILKATAEKHGGLMWAFDALQPEGHGTLLYVLYESWQERFAKQPTPPPDDASPMVKMAYKLQTLAKPSMVCANARSSP